jgi:peptidoglycan/LPS O-acetylase OafA/YrhL
VKSITLCAPVEPARRSQILDELRGLAILLVLTYHVGGVTGFPNQWHGELGVDVFVLLSGAALAFSHRPGENAWVFLWRRLGRLLPAYWIALTIFWQGGITWLNRIHTPTDVWSHYLCLHPWWGDKYFLGFADSFWFLGMIVPLYVVYAALRRFVPDRLDVVLGIGLALSFGVACWTALGMQQPAVFVHLGLRPAIFFAGLVVGVLWRQGRVELPLTPWLGIGVLLTFYGLFVSGLFIGYTVAGFSIFVAYYALRSHAEAAGQRWLCRGLAWIGVYSYEIFLLHQPLIRDYNHYLWNRFGGRVPDAVELALGVAAGLTVTLALACVLHRVAGWISRLITPPAAAA